MAVSDRPIQSGALIPVYVASSDPSGSPSPVDLPVAASSNTDVTLNNSDKTLTVPAGHEWVITWVWVKLITTNAAGNRLVTIEIQDAAGAVIGQVRAGIVQAASLTRYYMASPNLDQATAFYDTDLLTIRLPFIELKPGQKIRVYDKTAVAAGADDMDVHVQYEDRTL